MTSGRPVSFAVPVSPDPAISKRRVEPMRKLLLQVAARKNRVTALATLCAFVAALVAAGPTAHTAAAATVGLHVSGNHLLDANGNVVHLHGVNRSGTEYACVQGWGIFDGPSDAASIQAIASWRANIVHLGLNEDCILGINGVPSQYAGSNYMNAIVSYVNALHAHGLYAEVALMWAAPGTQKAQGHPQILDADHAGAALQAIASAFKGDPNTIIGLTSEPHDISWACWLNGGSSCSVGYTALGMQGALNAVRSTGATNPVTASGIDWANNLSQWLTYEPKDSAGQLMAEAHVYGKNTCDTTSCFDSNYGPVAAKVPMLWGETGETYDDSDCGSSYISTFLTWADAHGVGYEPWTWDTWGTCGSLINNYNGTPANAYGTWVRNHYLTFPAPSPPPVHKTTQQPTDFNGDGKADVAVFRPSTGYWLIRGLTSILSGTNGDIPVPGDYAGDRRADAAVYRPSTGYWYIPGLATSRWGLASDVPVPADYNGDGRSDVAVFRPSTGAWLIRGQSSVTSGTSGDVPVPADYTGDGKADPAVYRPSTGYWYIQGLTAFRWGLAGDIPVPADYNGDGKTDPAVFRPSTGAWLIRGQTSVTLGTSGDVPVPADYTGDRKADPAVYRPSTGYWYIRGLTAFRWGLAGDLPICSICRKG